MGNLENLWEKGNSEIVQDSAIPLPPEKKVVFFNDDFIGYRLRGMLGNNSIIVPYLHFLMAK